METRDRIIMFDKGRGVSIHPTKIKEIIIKNQNTMKEKINEVKKRIKETTGKEITDEQALYILKGEQDDSDFNCKQKEDISK